MKDMTETNNPLDKEKASKETYLSPLSTTSNKTLSQRNNTPLDSARREAIKEIELEAEIECLTSQVFKFFSGYYQNSWNPGLADEETGLPGKDLINSMRVWAGSIQGLTQEQVNYGIRMISKGASHTTFPPTPGEFRELSLSGPKAPKEEQKWYDYYPSKALIDEHNNTNKAWFQSLTTHEKEENAKKAILKFPPLEYHLKHNNVSVLDDSFTEHFLFKMLMEILGRQKEFPRQNPAEKTKEQLARSKEIAQRELKKIREIMAKASAEHRAFMRGAKQAPPKNFPKESVQEKETSTGKKEELEMKEKVNYPGNSGIASIIGRLEKQWWSDD